jgi:hypothetical protein
MKTDNTKKSGVWMLTVSYNDYNQHGAVPCCVWPTKPTLEELAAYFKYDKHQPASVMAGVAFLLHLQNGGGRQEVEHEWYDLDFVEFGKRIGEHD